MTTLLTNNREVDQNDENVNYHIEEPPELTEEDEVALNAILDKIGQERKAAAETQQEQ